MAESVLSSTPTRRQPRACDGQRWGGQRRGNKWGWYPEGLGSPVFLLTLDTPFTSLALSLLFCEMSLTAALLATPSLRSSWCIDVKVLRVLPSGHGAGHLL